MTDQERFELGMSLIDINKRNMSLVFRKLKHSYTPIDIFIKNTPIDIERDIIHKLCNDWDYLGFNFFKYVKELKVFEYLCSKDNYKQWESIYMYKKVYRNKYWCTLAHLHIDTYPDTWESLPENILELKDSKKVSVMEIYTKKALGEL